jgi:ADP-ribose pyrophosphatase YjhB (NUDIX family)
MIVFVNDKLVRFVTAQEFTPEIAFQKTLDGTRELNLEDLDGNVLVLHAKASMLSNFVQLVEGQKLKKLKSLTFVCDNAKEAFLGLKKNFKIIKAGGGIVEKDDKILLISRLGRWDLPKGKIEKKENIIDGALREVEEECNIQVELIEKTGITYHTYIRSNKRVLKKTYWYRMKCVDDSEMRPQLDEGILLTEWKSKEQTKILFEKSYLSLKWIYAIYFNEYGRNADTSPPNL